MSELPTKPDSSHQSHEHNMAIIEQEAIQFLNFLSEAWGIQDVDTTFLERFSQIDDQQGRLRALVSTDLKTAVQAMLDKGGAAKSYVLGRLKGYKDFLRDVEQGRVHPTDAITVKTISDGLIRDVLFAEMKGHPALGGLLVAKKRIGINDPHALSLLPQLKGYHSGVSYGKRFIGNYELLIKIYDQSLQEITHKYSRGEITEEQVEHKAVMLAAKWYEIAPQYSKPGRGPGSQYSRPISVTLGGPNPLESIDWARLSPGTRAQFRGMLHSKGLHHPLYNLGRFIGKSGDNKELRREVTTIEEEIQSIQQLKNAHTYESNPLFGLEGKSRLDEYISQQNLQDAEQIIKNGELKRQQLEVQRSRSLDRVNHLQLSEEDSQEFIEKIDENFNSQLVLLQEQVQADLARIMSRTADELLEQMKLKHSRLKNRFQRKKSLAAKAIDLHFHFTVAYEKRTQSDYDDEQFPVPLNHIDWINMAPLGTIKRAHRAWQQGLSDESIMAMAITDIFSGKEPFTRELYEKVLHELRESNSNHSGQRFRLRNMLEMRAILKSVHVDLSFDDLLKLEKSEIYSFASDKNRLERLAKIYKVDILKIFQSSEVYLYDIEKMRRSLINFGLQEFADDIDMVLTVISVWKKINKDTEHYDAEKNPVVFALAAGYTIEEIKKFPHLLSTYLIDYVTDDGKISDYFLNRSGANSLIHVPLVSPPIEETPEDEENDESISIDPYIRTRENLDDEDDDSLGSSTLRALRRSNLELDDE